MRIHPRDNRGPDSGVRAPSDQRSQVLQAGTFVWAEANGLKRTPLRATQDVRRLELNLADAFQRCINPNALGCHGRTLFGRAPDHRPERLA